ncbi:hypothetical protein ACPXB3_21050 [Gordonia sp. DT219]|uniref:hypothetical protein n=1 Tax=Gordonia sp. DT219 TaxID=3416658 RepID=UPI003CEE7F2D
METVSVASFVGVDRMSHVGAKIQSVASLGTNGKRSDRLSAVRRFSIAGTALDRDVTVADVETLVTKRAELLLRSCEVTWGPCLGRTPTSYGTTVAYLTVAPELLVEVDVVESAECAIATIDVPDAALAQRISQVLLDLEFDQEPGVHIQTGRSHPVSGNMGDTLKVLFGELDRHRHYVEYDGPLTDEDGRSLE